jgi:hypothetical protein
MRAIGKWHDKWFRHPIADMPEHAKLDCWLTDIDPVAENPVERESQLNHAGRLYLKASLA